MRGAAAALHGLTNAGTEVWWPGLVIAGIPAIIIIAMLFIRFIVIPYEEWKNNRKNHKCNTR